MSQLQSKTVYQCVEYYYAMKKLKKFKQRTQADKKEGGLDSVSVKYTFETHLKVATKISELNTKELKNNRDAVSQ